MDLWLLKGILVMTPKHIQTSCTPKHNTQMHAPARLSWSFHRQWAYSLVPLPQKLRAQKWQERGVIVLRQRHACAKRGAGRTRQRVHPPASTSMEEQCTAPDGLATTDHTGLCGSTPNPHAPQPPFIPLPLLRLTFHSAMIL